MRKRLSFFFSLLLSTSMYSQSISPEVIASSGEHFSENTIQLSWTIGEIMVETYSPASNVLTQGFHQSNLVITAVEDLAESFQLKVYPNPTTHLLHLEGPFISEVLDFALYDASGKQRLFQAAFNPAEPNTIDFSTYAAGSYFLRFSSRRDRKVIKSFKILKLK